MFHSRDSNSRRSDWQPSGLLTVLQWLVIRFISTTMLSKVIKYFLYFLALFYLSIFSTKASSDFIIDYINVYVFVVTFLLNAICKSDAKSKLKIIKIISVGMQRIIVDCSNWFIFDYKILIVILISQSSTYK